jgi:ribosomal protein S18 acetylase RimI-like enzyme
MTPAQFDAWSRHSVDSFAEQQVAAGLSSAHDAEAYAAQQFGALLPHGIDTPEHAFWHVVTVDPLAPGAVVGILWLQVRALSTQVEAYVFDIEIASQARGRGLGRAAMLAAEDVARELGADVARLNVFGHNASAIGLYESLGYAAASVSMNKRLSPADHMASSPAVPGVGGPPVRLRDMTAEEYLAFRTRVERDHPAELVRSGALPVEEARRRVTGDLAALLPRGRLSAGNLLWTGSVGTAPVGHIWLHLEDGPYGTSAFVHDLHVLEQDAGEASRRRLLTDLVGEVERECRARGAVSLGGSASGADAVARSTYERAGFAVTALTMTKRL